MNKADELIKQLQLTPHPEGGHYRETFRDSDTADGRSYSTAIYFLLKQGEISKWHRIDAVEIWHWYAGSPIALRVAQDGAAGQGSSSSAPMSPLAKSRRLLSPNTHGRARSRLGNTRWSAAP